MHFTGGTWLAAGIAWGCVLSAGAAGERFDARQSGAVGDGVADDTIALQRVIDDAAAAGGIAWVPAGRYVVRPLELKSNLTLWLDADAVLLGSTHRMDYSPRVQRALIMATGRTNIVVRGAGTIDGRGRELAVDTARCLADGRLPGDPVLAQALRKVLEQGKFGDTPRPRPEEPDRPHLLGFVDCRDVRVEDVTLRDGACWINTYRRCSGVTIRGVKVLGRAFWNNDGIDLVDCSDVVVSGCVLDTADDAICLKSQDPAGVSTNVLIENCDICSSASAVKIGTASRGTFRDIRIRDIRVRDTFRSALALESVDGGTIEQVTVERVAATNVGNAFFIRLGDRAQTGAGRVRDIRIRDLTAFVPRGKPDAGMALEGPPARRCTGVPPASIVGLSARRVERVTLEDCSIVFAGGFSADKRPGAPETWPIPEQAAAYPEFTMFGDLPAWGLFARQVDGLALRNVCLWLEQSDCRYPVFLDGVDGFEDHGLVVAGDGERKPVVMRQAR